MMIIAMVAITSLVVMAALPASGSEGSPSYMGLRRKALRATGLTRR